MVEQPGSIDKPTVTVGDTVTISYDIEDAEGVASVSPGISDVDPKDIDPSQGIPGAWTTSGASASSWSFDVKSSTAPGKRWVTTLAVTDNAG